MKLTATCVGLVVMFFGAILGIALLLAFPTKWLVNYLFTPNVLSATFGVARFDIWHALCLNTLAGFLFSGRVKESK